MRSLAVPLAFALAFAFALAGCTKAPAPQQESPQAVPTGDGSQASSQEPTPSTSPTPQPSSSPTSPTPSSPTTPTPQNNTPPVAAPPPDYFSNKSGWVVPDSQSDPNATIRLTFPLAFGAKNFTVRAGDATITPQGAEQGAPFAVTITDPQGRSVGPNASTVDNPVMPVPAPDAPSGAPETKTIDKDATSLPTGEYTITLTITPALSNGDAGLGDRYSLSVYVHYGP